MPQPYSFGIIGFPLSHSLSPLMHKAALDSLQLSGEYKTYPLSPDRDGRFELARLVDAVRNGHIDGLNVTIPYKSTVIEYLDVLSSIASAIGAVNTIYFQDRQVYGENTDAPGFSVDLSKLLRRELASVVSSLASPGALVLGAGGSARAVVFTLAAAGWQVFLAARNIDQAWQIVHDFSTAIQKAITISPIKYTIECIAEVGSKIDLIVNTTPVGMYPNIAGTPWPGGLEFPPGVVVYDLIYNPGETMLMRMARESGLTATNGLGMLVEQAALAFKLWTGCEAPLAMMRKAAEISLSAGF